MKTTRRTDRIGSLVREALSELLLFSVNDPRVRDCVVTRVQVTPDLSLARIGVRPMAGREDTGELLAGLAASKGFLRSELGRRVRLLRTPRLEFDIDNEPGEAERVLQILDEIK